MSITNLQETIIAQIELDEFLKNYDLKDLVGDYGELIVQNAIGGERQKAVNQGFDILHEEYNRIEVKTRKYKIDKNGKTRKENRAVGFSGKENHFDWLAHVVLDKDFTVLHACLAKYSEVWPFIQQANKISYKTSCNLQDSIDITALAIKAQCEINNRTS